MNFGSALYKSNSRTVSFSQIPVSRRVCWVWALKFNPTNQRRTTGNKWRYTTFYPMFMEWYLME